MLPRKAMSAPDSSYGVLDRLVPIEAEADRIAQITVCLRPFRPQGPRVEPERVGDKLVIHNYGHGGSGWSLSWGSAAHVLQKIADAGGIPGDVAVIGCGALGLTAAITAQRAGMRVVIYTKDRPPYVRSSRATGSWTPDSRVALESGTTAAFVNTWERMARTSFTMYQSYLGVAGTPIEWTDRYIFSRFTHDYVVALSEKQDHHGFADYGDRIADITPGWHDVRTSDGRVPFGMTRARRSTSMTFNIADYSRQLVNDYLTAGGVIETREFHSPNELSSLPERTIVNCTGYAARALWSDESIVPIRGQIAWLIPQQGVNYGMGLDGLVVLGRRDGIAVQPNLQGADTGWNDDNETPDRAAAEVGVARVRAFFEGAGNATGSAVPH